MKVELDLPMWVWGRFASIADAEHTTVQGLLTDHVVEMAGTPSMNLAVLQSELTAARKTGWRAPRR